MSNTFLIKKQRYEAIRTIKTPLKIFICGVFILMGLFLANKSVLAAVPFQDNFNNYQVGYPLNINERWSDSDDEWIIAETGCFSGRCAFISAPSQELYARGLGEDTTTGNLTFYVIFKGTLGNNVQFLLQNNTGLGGTFTVIFFDFYGIEEGKFTLFNRRDAGQEIIAENIIDEIWYNIKVEWKAEADFINKVRYNFDENGWTGWFDTKNPIPNQLFINQFLIASVIGADYLSVDEIATVPICELGSCGICETYNTCSAAGCFWYYSIYLQEYFCVEPFEPEPEECGGLYKCQYCLSEETCETEPTCEWIDKGLGEKCYLKEPIIPPAQVGWEVPELEDCEELGTVEKWLCEIKNFIAGIFMPSQEKINDLYNTFGAMKEKFPFNYAAAIGNFLDDVKASLATEKDIPISIFGNEENVSFAFWENTATIGGKTETFFNVVKDFTSIIIVLGWFVWLSSFIRRFLA